MSKENESIRVTISMTAEQLSDLDQYVEENGILNRSAAIRQLISDQKNIKSIKDDIESQRKAINHMDRELQIMMEIMSSIVGINDWNEFYPTDSKDAPGLITKTRNYVASRIHSQSINKYTKKKTGQ